jgi:hypothetical protein
VHFDARKPLALYCQPGSLDTGLGVHVGIRRRTVLLTAVFAGLGVSAAKLGLDQLRGAEEPSTEEVEFTTSPDNSSASPAVANKWPIRIKSDGLMTAVAWLPPDVVVTDDLSVRLCSNDGHQKWRFAAKGEIRSRTVSASAVSVVSSSDPDASFDDATDWGVLTGPNTQSGETLWTMETTGGINRDPIPIGNRLLSADLSNIIRVCTLNDGT